jgi:hypothetical protein
VNVAGQAATVAMAERALGCDSRSVVFQPSAFGFAADEEYLRSDASWLAAEAARWKLLWRAMVSADVVHFYFGQTILFLGPCPGISAGFRYSLKRGFWRAYVRAVWLKDLPLLKALGKVVVMTYQGDDARQGRSARGAISPLAGIEDYYTAETDAWKRRAIDVVGRWADHIYALNPDLLNVLPASARFLPYANVDLNALRPGNHCENRVPVVVHAPSKRNVKGTVHILAAIERLKAEGIRVELDLVEGCDNQVARERFRRADLAIDQLLLGWYGGFAVECMALGKPVLAYLRREDLAFIPQAMRDELPVIPVSPATLYDVLRDWVGRNRAGRDELGARSRRYVERWHDPLVIAGHLVGDYRRTLSGESGAAHPIDSPV